MLNFILQIHIKKIIWLRERGQPLQIKRWSNQLYHYQPRKYWLNCLRLLQKRSNKLSYRDNSLLTMIIWSLIQCFRDSIGMMMGLSHLWSSLTSLEITEFIIARKLIVTILLNSLTQMKMANWITLTLCNSCFPVITQCSELKPPKDQTSISINLITWLSTLKETWLS